MASNIKDSGVDLDSIFEVISTTKIGNVNIKSGGTDISNSYEKLASGSAAPVTGIKTGGADLNTKFAELGSVVSAVVTVSGETIVDQGAGDRLYRATLRVTNNGNMHKFESMTVTQIDTADDWVRPTSAASIDYEVKYDYVSGDVLHSSTTSDDGEWKNLAADKFFECRHLLGAGIGKKETVITISIRKNGGSVLDSANYSLRAERLF